VDWKRRPGHTDQGSAHDIDPAAQLVLCAGAPEIAEETAAAVAELSAARPGVIWIQKMVQLSATKPLPPASGALGRLRKASAADTASA
jgi:hypothetical protein